MVYFRTDANEIIGIGHMMRCLSISNALTEMGVHVSFLVSDERSADLVRKAGGSCTVLGIKQDDPDKSADIRAVKKVVADGKGADTSIPVVVIDSYNVSEQYFSAIRETAITAYIDDLLVSGHDIDILINYDIQNRTEILHSFYGKSRTKLLTGTAYTPLRAQFAGDIVREGFYFPESGEKLNVLVSGGGGTAAFVLYLITVCIDDPRLENVCLKVICGECFGGIDRLRELEREHPDRLCVMQNVTEMKDLMMDCHLAVSASGTLPYECCATGLPVILYCDADNQLPDARFFSENGFMPYAGDVRQDREKAAENIIQEICRLGSMPDEQRKASERLKGLIDGRGAERIARAIVRAGETGSFFESEPAAGTSDRQDIFEYLEATAAGQNTDYYDSGRGAIAAAIKSIETKDPGIAKRCILPIYTCETVIQPFEGSGWDIRYYEVKRDLEPDGESITALIEGYGPSVILLHPYYGTDTVQNVYGCLERISPDRRPVVIEDMTQALFMTPDAVKRAEYVVGSIRKWLPVPDGGYCISAFPLPEGVTGDGKFAAERLDAMKEKELYFLGADGADKAHFLHTNRETEDARCSDRESAPAMSEETADMASGIDISYIMDRRKENARIVDTALSGLKRVHKILDMQSGQAPLYYPVYADDREDLQRYLQEHDIYAPVLWPVYEAVEKDLTPGAGYIYEHLLALPCDQRYDKRYMDRMTDIIRKYDGR